MTTSQPVSLAELQRHMELLERVLDDPERLAQVALVKAKGVPAQVTDLCHELAADRGVHWVGITLVDDRYQHVMTSSGAVVSECRREDGHCQYVIGSGGTLALNDVEQHGFWRRLHRNVVEGRQLHAYIGVPLRFNRQVIGSVCAVDIKPRVWTAQDHDALVQLANKVVVLLEGR